MKWFWLLFSLALCALGLAPSYALAQGRVGYCQQDGARDMPQEYPSGVDGIRHFRTGCRMGGQIDYILNRVNSSIDSPEFHIKREHIIPLNNFNYVCRFDHGRRGNRMSSAHGQLSMQDYADRACRNGSVEIELMPNQLVVTPASGRPTPTEMVSRMVTELQSMTTITFTQLEGFQARLRVEEERTDATPIERRARIAFSDALTARVHASALAEQAGAPVTSAAAAPVETVQMPHTTITTRDVTVNSHFKSLFSISFIINLVFFAFIVSLLWRMRQRDQRLSHAETMVPPEAQADGGLMKQLREQVRNLQEQLIAANKKSDDLVVENAKLRTAQKNSLPPAATADAPRLSVMIEEKLEDVLERYRMKLFGVLPELFAPTNSAGERLSIMASFLVRFHTDKTNAQQSLRLAEDELEKYRDLTMRHRGQKLSVKQLTDDYEQLHQFEIHGAHFGALAAPKPPSDTLLGMVVGPHVGLPPVQTGATQAGIAALMSTPPPAEKPPHTFMTVSEENRHLREENDALRTQVAGVQGFTAQLYATYLELARNFGVDISLIPTFDVLEVEVASDVVQSLYDQITKAADRIDEMGMQLKGQLEEANRVIESIRQDALAANRLAADESHRASEAHAETLAARRDLEAANALTAEEAQKATEAKRELEAKLQDLALMKVQLDDAQVQLMAAEGLRRGLHFNMTERVTALEALVTGYASFLEEGGKGKEMVLSVYGETESLMNFLRTGATPKAEWVSGFKNLLENFFLLVSDFKATASLKPSVTPGGVAWIHPKAVGNR